MPVLRSRFGGMLFFQLRWEMAPTLAPWLADSGNGAVSFSRESSFCAFPSVRIQTRNPSRQVSGKRDSCQPMLFYIRFLSIRPLSPVDRRCRGYCDSCVREWRKENAPVNMEQRAGELAGITVYALLNHTFSCANRSTKGVTSSGKPSLPHKSARC